MSNTRKFFHDRFILFVLTINSFLAFMSMAVLLFRLGGPESVYFKYVRFQPSNVGIPDYAQGGIGDSLAFVAFALGLFIVHIFMALEFYKVRRTSAWVVMLLTTLLLILNFIVANALLDLR